LWEYRLGIPLAGMEWEAVLLPCVVAESVVVVFGWGAVVCGLGLMCVLGLGTLWMPVDVVVAALGSSSS